MNPDAYSITWLLGGALQPYVDIALDTLGLIIALCLVLAARVIGEALIICAAEKEMEKHDDR